MQSPWQGTNLSPTGNQITYQLAKPNLETEYLLKTSGTWWYPENLGKYSLEIVIFQSLASLKIQKRRSMYLPQWEQQVKWDAPLLIAWASDERKLLC